MTFKTGKGLHSHAVDALVLVAFLAGILIGPKEVKTLAMTHLTLYIEHEDMFGMTV